MPLTRPGQNGTAPGPLMGEPPPEVPRDQYGRPRIRPADGSEGLVSYTRASTLGDALEDSFGITRWRVRCAVLGTALNRSVAVGAMPCTLEDRAKLDELAELAHETAGGNSAARIGTAIHSLCDLHDRGLEVPPDDELDGCMAAYRAVIARFQVHAIEQFVVNDKFEAAGTTDRFVSPLWPMQTPDGRTVTPDDVLPWDLKTAKTATYFGPKFAVQLATYAGGVPYCPQRGRLEWPWGRAPRTDWGLICHLPSGGDTAQLYWVDLAATATFASSPSLAEVALAVRKLRKQRLFYPVDPPAEQAPVLNEVGFAAELRAARTADDVVAIVARLGDLASDGQKAKARARWAELNREPVA